MRLHAISTTVSCFSFSSCAGERGGRAAAAAGAREAGEEASNAAEGRTRTPAPRRTLVVAQRAEGEEAQQLQRRSVLCALQLRGARERCQPRGGEATPAAAGSARARAPP